MDMQIPGLAEDGDHRGPGVHQFAYVAVLFNRVLREACGTERRQLRVLQLQVTRPREELPVFGIGTGPSAFNVINTELVQFLANEDFVLHRK